MEHLAARQRLWSFLRAVVGPVIRRMQHYTPEVCRAEGTLLVLSNHVTDWDAIFVSMAFPRYMSFVASEHLFRLGWLSKVLVALLAPIARLKATSALDTVLTMVRRLKQGVSVALFPEGVRSFQGTTEPIMPVIAKMAQSCGATLVTYRIRGGYLASPSWSGSRIRKGKIRGEVAGVYPPEQLKAMTADEVYRLICRDLWVDAYADQKEAPVVYKCKGGSAEYLERILCLCPACGGIGTLHSHGDRISCGCGFSARYTPTGFFEGAPYENLHLWDEAQTRQLERMADALAEDQPLFADDDITLRQILRDHTVSQPETGCMKLYRDRLEVCGNSFPLSDITGINLHGPQTIDLAAARKSYEIKCSRVYSARKYKTMVEYLQNKQDS